MADHCLRDRQPARRGGALGNLGSAWYLLGEPRRAIDYYEQHLVIAREIGDRRGEGNALGNLGVAYQNLGEPRRAIDYYKQALAIYHEIGDQRIVGQILESLTQADAAIGNQIHDQVDFNNQVNDLANLDDLENARVGPVQQIGDQHSEDFSHGDRDRETENSWNLGLEMEAQGMLRRAVELMQVRVDFLRSIEHPEADWCAAIVEGIRQRL